MLPKAVCKYDTDVMQTIIRIAYDDNRQISYTRVPYCCPIGSAISQLDQWFCGFPFPTSNVATVSRHLIALLDSHAFLPALISKLRHKAAIYLLKYSKTFRSPFTSFYLQTTCTERKRGTTNNELLEAKLFIKFSLPQKHTATRCYRTALSSFSFSVYRLPISCFKGVKI